MLRVLPHLFVLLVAAALALAPRPTAREADSPSAAPPAGDARRLGASVERPGPGAALPPVHPGM